jgi:hypothetical protein
MGDAPSSSVDQPTNYLATATSALQRARLAFVVLATTNNDPTPRG